MKANEIKEALKLAYAIKKPLYIEGPPGIGKSALVHQFAAENELAVLDCRLVHWDPVDLRGMPSISKGTTTWLTPAIFPREGKGVIFLDELPQAAPAVQAACFQLIQDRRLAEYTVPPGWLVVGAGNSQTDRAGANRLLSPIVSKMMFATMEVDLNAWSQWAIDSNLNPLVLACIRFRVDLLHQFDPSKWNGKSYPCPRTWEMLGLALDHEPQLGSEMMSGIVGEGAAVEFAAYRELCTTLPSLDGIILDPHGAPVPDKPSACFAVVTGLARKAKAGNLGKIYSYGRRLQREFGVMLAKDIISRKPDLQLTPEHARWCLDNQDLMS